MRLTITNKVNKYRISDDEKYYEYNEIKGDVTESDERKWVKFQTGLLGKAVSKKVDLKSEKELARQRSLPSCQNTNYRSYEVEGDLLYSRESKEASMAGHSVHGGRLLEMRPRM